MPPIFDGVYFAIIPSQNLEEAEISRQLGDNGGVRLALSSSIPELRPVTHIISTHVDFPAFLDALQGLINVVTPQWVLDSVTKGKAASTRQYSPDPQFFFSGVTLACADDIPEGDKDAIIGGVLAMGGQYSAIMTKTVTHVVAQSIHPPQCQIIINKKLKCKPVLSHWFDACLRLGKKIDCGPYVIPEKGQPALYRDRVEDMTKPASPKFEGTFQLTPTDLPQMSTPPDSPSKGRRELSVFTNRRVMLHDDLKLSNHLKSSLKEIIVDGGGNVVDNLVEATALICHYRESKEFQDAYRAGKEVGNLNWLYHLIQRNRWTAPTDRLLHFPYPRDGIDGFERYRISVSNYSGEARIYLESLIEAAKGKFTKTLTQENTHLITAHRNSEKCDAAAEWRVHMVNHLWLEESYARGKVESVSNTRYTTFPERTNLAEVVGQEHIDRDKLAQAYGFDRLAVSSVRSSPTTGGKSEPDVSLSSTLQTPAAKSDRKQRSAQTPAARFTVREDTPASRGAKDRALSKLHDMANDIALYEKESKRVGGVVYGGRRATDPDRIDLGERPAHQSRKRSISEADSEDATSTTGLDKNQTSNTSRKKSKMGRPTKSKEEPLAVLLTGINDPDSFRSDQKLRSLNLRFTEDPLSNVDVIVAPRLLRTRKFLCGIACAPLAIVDTSWLDAMITQGARVPLEDYALEDLEEEKDQALKLEEVLRRSHANKAKGGMLSGWTIFATENVRGGIDPYKDIALVNGGTCLLFKGRQINIPVRGPTSLTSAGRDASGEPDGVQALKEGAAADMNDEEACVSETTNGEAETKIIHLLSDVADEHLWDKFRSMAQKQGFKALILKPDWLLRIAMSQDANEWIPGFDFLSES